MSHFRSLDIVAVLKNSQSLGKKKEWKYQGDSEFIDAHQDVLPRIHSLCLESGTVC